MTSKVYFMDDHAGGTSESTPFKAVKLLRDAGLETLFKKGDKVGIKVHFSVPCYTTLYFQGFQRLHTIVVVDTRS